jgi:DNA-binding HxlR family transcriptional regulator
VGDLNCSVARTLSVIGDRWTMLVLRNAFIGIRRFDDFQRQLGVTRHVLAERLKRLVDAQIFSKVLYQPSRFEYRLTDKGRALYPILLALTAWGDTWMDEGRGPPLYYHHNTCGHRMTPVMVCSACNEPLVARDVIAMVGPGLASVSDLK